MIQTKTKAQIATRRTTMNANTLPPTPNTPHPASNTLNPSQQREHQVWQLRIRCYSQFDIAEELGISQAAVSQILKRVRARLAAEFAAGAADALTEQVEQLMHIAKEALAAYHQSKVPAHPTEAPPISQNQNPAEQSSNQNPVPSPNPTNPGSDQPEADPPDYRQDVPPGIGWGVLCGAAKRGQAEELGGRAGVPTKPKEGKSAFLRIAIQALAAVRAIRATFQPEQNPCDDNVKMIVGIDLDHMKYKNGDPVQRAEVDRLIALNNAR